MPLVFVVVVLRFVAVAVRAFRDKAPQVKPQPLCADCFFAHIQYGAKAQCAISCTYGGTVRPMKLDVLYCTDYRDRNPAERARPLGFVCNIETASQA